MIFPRELRTFVSPQCIKLGIRKDGDRCPIVYSLRGRYQSVYVSTNYVWVSDKENFSGTWAWYVLDSVGKEFLERFDLGLSVIPIAISLIRVHVYRY